MINLLSSTAYLIVNKKLSKKVGLQAAALLADLISKQLYFIDEEYFFNTEANIEKDTTLSPYQQRACITKLKSLGLISVVRKGIPARRYFKVNEAPVMQLLNNKSEDTLRTINNNKRINNNITNKNTLPIRKVLFKNEVKELDILNELEADKFIDYWTEPNKNNTKMRYELAKTWSTKLRLKNWARNTNKWSSNKATNSKIDIQLNEYEKGKDLIK